MGFDLSKVSGFITRNFNSYVDLQEKRNNLTKYVQLIFIKILNDSQYGESMINMVKQVFRYYLFFFFSRIKSHINHYNDK